MEEVCRNWEAVDTHGNECITFDEFQTWYCGTFQIEHSDYTNFFSPDDALDENEVMIRDVARNLGMGVTEVEKIWEEFSQIDIAKRNKLDYEQFKALVAKQSRSGGSSLRGGPLLEVPDSTYK